jgi:hypothetical protein
MNNRRRRRGREAGLREQHDRFYARDIEARQAGLTTRHATSAPGRLRQSGEVSKTDNFLKLANIDNHRFEFIRPRLSV